MKGRSFSSRVSTSLLSSLNLEQLSTNNYQEYYNKIDYFCSNRNELKKIRDLLLNYKNNNLNRMKLFTKNFEDLKLRKRPHIYLKF